MGIKILIVDGATSVVRTLGYALTEREYEIVPTESAREGLAKAAAQRPDLVILDTNLPDMAATEFCRELRRDPQSDELPIIMLSDETGVADRISGLKAGANEYVTKPFDVDEVVARGEALLGLTRHLRPIAPAERGKIISLIGAKGGVGATTVALNVAAALASQRIPTIAVELRDSFGTCALQLGESPQNNLSSLLQLDPEHIDTQALRQVLTESQSGIGVLFGPQKVDEPQAVEPEHARAILQGLASLARYTIVDLPCHLSAATKAAIQESDYVMVVVEHGSVAWSAGKVLLAQLASWGVGKDQFGAVVVKRSPSGRPLKATESSLELGCDVLGVFPPAEEICQDAQQSHSPIVLSQGSSAPAMALTEIANKLKARFAILVGA